MKNFVGSTRSSRTYLERLLSYLGLGMRAKLIIIFVVIKVIPLLLLAGLAWRQTRLLGDEVSRRTQELIVRANASLAKTGDIAVSDSVNALNERAIEDIERMSTDTARRVADFLYERDVDILYVSGLKPDEEVYRHYVESVKRNTVRQENWKLAEDGKSWVPEAPEPELLPVESTNQENDRRFHYRPKDTFEYEKRPLYLEITFIDTEGNERVKATTSSRVSPEMKDVSDRRNTFVKAEDYWQHLKKLKPGEIYVSDVIGAYVPSRIIGMYTPEAAAEKGLEFAPEKEAWAGMENPLGKRFEALVRWATPVMEDDRIIGYVTLALDHDHLMEFTSHLIPTQKRYTEIPSAYEGNYAFIWDYKCRSIVHPRHHSIVGYDPETGDPQIPWLENSIYEAWQASGKSYVDFIKNRPTFVEQSVKKKPAKTLTDQGLVGLDGRYLDFAPQCTGWFDLTREGGSGSFVILWSGLSKLTTAATIPYYTGHYGASKRGFGFVAIGAGLDDFHRPARETEKVLDALVAQSDRELSGAAQETQEAVNASLVDTAVQLAMSAGVMVILVVLIAIWMASVFTRSITKLIQGISRFRAGERHFRFNAPVKDELGMLADSFDDMADSLVDSVRGPLTITDTDCRVIYMNDDGLRYVGKTLPEILGQPYSENSVYAFGSRYCPITALREGREAEVMYLPQGGNYIKGKATYLKNREGSSVGYIIMTTDVSELVKKQLELEEAMCAANKANESKGEFLARMSHEIRTPMNAIIGMTNIVKKKLNDKATDIDIWEIRGYVGQIENSSQHLLGLLNDILDISKIEAGRIELVEESVDLLRLTRTVEAIIRPRCQEKNIVFETLFDVSEPSVFTSDSLRLRQVLINLLGNAVKFTPECGRVDFCVEEKAREDNRALVRFSVRDTGIGIAEGVLPSLFQPFEQGGGQVTRRYGGTGLGLTISLSIVRLFGGDIHVISKEGEGSTFSFEIWLEQIAVDPGVEDVVSGLNGINLFTGKKALLVDDVPVNRIIAVDFLSSTGIAIEEAEDGAAALKMFEESAVNEYDIIFMDVQMPNMDGYEASSAIRALDRPDAKTVPIVALTANAFREDIEKALSHGMNAHLAKPLEPERLLEVTAKLLNMDPVFPTEEKG